MRQAKDLTMVTFVTGLTLTVATHIVVFKTIRDDNSTKFLFKYKIK